MPTPFAPQGGVGRSTKYPQSHLHLFTALPSIHKPLYCGIVTPRYDLEQELLSLALKSPPAVMLDAADHLLAQGNGEAAALLYQKGGKMSRAVDMAFSAQLFGVLDSIAEQLGPAGDPALLARYGYAAGHAAGCLPVCRPACDSQYSAVCCVLTAIYDS